MNLLFHNIRVAFRNIMNYKLQTCISVAGIAIGIVILSLVISAMGRLHLPNLYNQPYGDRTYILYFTSADGWEMTGLPSDLLRNVINGTEGLKSAEKIIGLNSITSSIYTEFHLSDSTIRKGQIGIHIIDPQHPDFIGLRSAVTGEKIKVLKPGEAIISESLAKKIFHDANPVGAVQVLTNYQLPFPVTIVDVYHNVSSIEGSLTNEALLFPIADNIVDTKSEVCYIGSLYILLRDNYSASRIEDEINEKAKAFGVKVVLEKALNDKIISVALGIKWLIYLIGSLILLAALIGFIRLQTQLFRLRRREISLRIVNGAKFHQLFCLLVTEVLISIVFAIAVALVLGTFLQEFIDLKLNDVLDRYSLEINNLWIYSLVIGGVLLAICSVIAWITLRRVLNNREGLAVHMRRRHNHLFRNATLCIQIAISIIFVCGTFIIVRAGTEIIKLCHIPDDEQFYKECLTLMPSEAEDPQLLLEEISRLPDLERMVMYGGDSYHPILEIKNDPEVMEKVNYQCYYKFYCARDTSMLSLLGYDVEWLNQNVDRNQCMLLGEKTYEDFRNLGLLEKNLISFESESNDITLPIGGIVRNIPYEMDSRIIIGITPEWGWDHKYALIPKPGKAKALARNVNETIKRLEPEQINPMVWNFRDNTNQLPLMVETAKGTGWILGTVSILICIMSIFSAITLNTRARKKEIAIRKVNGAKTLDIYRMFANIYVVLTLIALLIAIPVAVMFNDMVENSLVNIDPDCTLSPLQPILLGIAVVIILIFSIVGWQIHKVVRTDPSKIIAKE